MTYLKTIDNNYIFSICASRMILVIHLGHDSMHYLPTSLSHRSCHKDDTCGWIFIKHLYMAVQNAQSACSFLVISLWLGIQQNVMNLPLDYISWRVCKTLFLRGFLLSWLYNLCQKNKLSVIYVTGITLIWTKSVPYIAYTYTSSMLELIMQGMQQKLENLISM